jgi:hypothetical protein
MKIDLTRFKFKKDVYTELDIARREKTTEDFSGRFQANYAEKATILPILNKKVSFLWILESITHESLHLLLFDFIDPKTSHQLDNLGYNYVSGYNKYYKGTPFSKEIKRDKV